VRAYLAELYVPRSGSDGVRDAALRARAAADELRRSGTAVRFLRSIFVPAEETCFLLYEAESAESVRRAGGEAGIALDRILEAVVSR
jgi:hypothetical protein